jgi:hypothetical protein
MGESDKFRPPPWLGPPEETAALRARVLGADRTGTVGLRDFDQGVVETLGAVPYGDFYLLDIPGVEGPPGIPVPPGMKSPVPITFAFPEAVLDRFRIPIVLVKRESIEPALNRWHPGALQYQTSARWAHPVVVQQGLTTLNGYNANEYLPQAVPYDITYTVSVIGRYRGTKVPGQRSVGIPPPNPVMSYSNLILNFVMKTYQPYCEVRVKDSIGDLRGYEAFTEGPSHLDEVSEVVERVIGFALTLRVEAELDLNGEDTAFAALSGEFKLSQI